MDEFLIWNVKGMIAVLGGPTSVRTMALKEGLEPPKYRTVQMWKQRNTAPAHAIALLLVLLRKASPNLNWDTWVERVSMDPEGND